MSAVLKRWALSSLVLSSCSISLTRTGGFANADGVLVGSCGHMSIQTATQSSDQALNSCPVRSTLPTCLPYRPLYFIHFI
ncbi:hypothetical protein F5Y14DRAFT_433377 [Nemania sp. NC0429]|nr:hypothetical protein F5Y14DRAFT_433377 [Nemania sp. NC0429]